MENTILGRGRVEALAIALETLAESQKLIKVDKDSWEAKPSKDNIRQYSLAMIDEVLEYIRELGWKDWKLPRVPDPTRVVDEFADILAFMGVLLQYGIELTGTTVGDFAEAYRRKTLVNIERINEAKVEGYGALKYHGQEQVEPGSKSVFAEAVVAAHDRALKLEVNTYYRLTYDNEVHNWARLDGYNAELGILTFEIVQDNGESHWTQQVRVPIAEDWKTEVTLTPEVMAHD